jgi:hypothetical protein
MNPKEFDKYDKRCNVIKNQMINLILLEIQKHYISKLLLIIILK